MFLRARTSSPQNSIIQFANFPQSSSGIPRPECSGGPRDALIRFGLCGANSIEFRRDAPLFKPISTNCTKILRRFRFTHYRGDLFPFASVFFDSIYLISILLFVSFQVCIMRARFFQHTLPITNWIGIGGSLGPVWALIWHFGVGNNAEHYLAEVVWCRNLIVFQRFEWFQKSQVGFFYLKLDGVRSVVESCMQVATCKLQYVLQLKSDLKKHEKQTENYTYNFSSIFSIRLELNLQSTAIANGPIEGIKRLNPVVIIADLTLKPFGNHFVVLSGLN